MKIPYTNLHVFTEPGTLIGLRVGDKSPNQKFYMDFFVARAPFRLRRFVNDRVIRRWETLRLEGWVLDKIQVLDPENAARVFRRTMKPYVLAYYGREEIEVELMSYPCPNDDGRVTIMARLVPDDPSTLRELNCEKLRPVSFRPTQVPAENPVAR
jgi:hypothetical protein